VQCKVARSAKAEDSSATNSRINLDTYHELP
jgi:hypothetical protein